MRYRDMMGAVAVAAVLLAAPALGQVVDYGKYPAFMGQWDRQGPPNNWRQLGGPPPLTPEYQKVWDDATADVKSGKPGVICGQGPAPKAATIARFHEFGLDMVPGSGLLAACVPGTVFGAATAAGSGSGVYGLGATSARFHQPPPSAWNSAAVSA